MARILIVLLHLLIAATAGMGAGAWAVQMRVNATWELGFYGGVSLITWAGVVAVVLASTLCVVQVALSVGWLLRWHRAGWGLLLMTVFYVCLTPPPIRWMLMLAGILIGLELVLSRGRQAAESAP